MKMFLLMVLFSTPDSPAPHELFGFGPRPAETMKQCRQRRSALQAYIESTKHPDMKFKVFCVEFQAVGYAEALESFRHEIGDPL